jgi:hypothetical protein
MRFIMMIKSNADVEAGALPDQQLLTDMGRLNEEMAKEGVMLSGEGLQPSSKGARLRLADKKLTVIDGPFAEARELIAGFWMIQARDKDEAVAWAKRVPGKDFEIEIRPLFEMGDFPVDASEQPGGWRENELHFREANAPTGGAGQPGRKPGTRRFILMLKSDRMTESNGLPAPALLAKMGALMEELARSGTLLAGDGLKPSSHGVRVRATGDKRTVIDGPFTEAKEMIAGYSTVQVKSLQEAVEIAKRWLAIHAEGAGLPEGEMEIRLISELEDFPVDPSEKPDGWRQQEQRLRERLGQ